MKVFVTGASGYLGMELCRQLSLSSNMTLYAGYLNHQPRFGIPCPIDITDHESVKQAAQLLHPDWVIHTAYNKTTAEMGKSVVQGTKNLAQTFSSRRFVHISTDFVFDGFHGPYGEDDIPTPNTDYGRYKLEAEKLVQQNCPEHLIVRTSLISGKDPIPPRWQSELNKLRQGIKLTFFSNEIRNPIHIEDLADGIILAASSDYGGLLHIAGPRYLSRFEELQLVAQWQNIPANLIASAISDGKNRPLNCSLKIDRFRSLFDYPLRDPLSFWI